MEYASSPVEQPGIQTLISLKSIFFLIYFFIASFSASKASGSLKKEVTFIKKSFTREYTSRDEF